MSQRKLWHAWLLLVMLGALTAAMAAGGAGKLGQQSIAVAAILVAGIKARIILASYLGLAASRFWTRTFDIALGGFIALAIGTYLAGTGG